MTDHPLTETPDEVEAPELETEEAQAATKAQVFCAAERLFALHGFQNVSVRDITAEAGVNLASVNYHFGSKDALLLAIFRRRTSELNRERARMLHAAHDSHAGRPPVREILKALFAPPVRCLTEMRSCLMAVQFRKVAVEMSSGIWKVCHWFATAGKSIFVRLRELVTSNRFACCGVTACAA